MTATSIALTVAPQRQGDKQAGRHNDRQLDTNPFAAKRRPVQRPRLPAHEETVVQLYTRERVLVAGDDAAAALTGWGTGLNGGGDRTVDDCAHSLLRTIEAEIIPRLMLAHGRARNDDDGSPAAATEPTAPEQIAELTAILLHSDPGAAQAYVQARRAAGMALEHMYLDLLAPVAQRLGAMWEADQVDFTQVTVGLWRLQQIVHEYGAAFQRERNAAGSGRRALLMAAPGSQHTFGLLMVSEFFRRAGWQVSGDPTYTAALAARELARGWFDVIGLSVGSECHVDRVTSAILDLRKASANPFVAVMVGGPVVGLRDDFVKLVGADATANDAATAVLLADRLVAQRAGPS